MGKKRMLTYTEKLQDARWQKRSDEILISNNHTCNGCWRNADMLEHGEKLHAHHCYYEKGKDPWDYPDHAFQCLCTPCHEKVERALSMLRKVVGGLEPEQIISLSESLVRIYVDAPMTTGARRIVEAMMKEADSVRSETAIARAH